MRKLFLASTAVFLLTGGVALAGGSHGGHGGSSTTTVVVPIKNATSVGTGNSSATTGGTAISAKNSDNTSNSNNTAIEVTKNLSDVGNTALEFVRTDTKIDVKLATSSNEGSVGGTFYINDPTCGCENKDHKSSGTGALTGNASMSEVNGGNGINTAQQNTGVNSLQQSSVALGSVVTGSTGSGVGAF